MTRRYTAVFLRGVAMGAADVVPGVSGGTIAFITGIYDELIDSIKAFDLAAVRVLFRQGPAAFWRHVNGSFLLSLIFGIVVSVLSLAKAISYALEHHPTLLSSFFFGLILASAWFVYRQIPESRWRLLWLLAGLALAVFIGEIRPAHTPVNPLSIFLSGALAICAMILPGISGSFILLLLGMYEPVIAAIKSLDVVTAAIFAAGCACGLLVFVRFLSWLLHQHRAPLLSVLTGILIGSLSIIWPWKLTEAAPQAAHHGVALNMHNVWPWHEGLADPQLGWCLGLMVLGLGLVLLLEALAER
jgi:putative membrane protein